MQFECSAADGGVPQEHFCKILRLLVVQGPLAVILAELGEAQKDDYLAFKELVKQRAGVSAETMRLKFWQLKRGPNQTFSQFASELNRCLRAWMQLAQVHSLEDLCQQLLLESLFGAVPSEVLKHSASCRSADVFTSALRLDKLIADAFGGAILKKEGKGIKGRNEPLVVPGKIWPEKRREGKEGPSPMAASTAQDKAEARAGAKIICWSCGLAGHQAANCYANEGRNRGKASAEGEKSSAWNSGALESNGSIKRVQGQLLQESFKLS